MSNSKVKSIISRRAFNSWRPLTLPPNLVLTQLLKEGGATIYTKIADAELRLWVLYLLARGRSFNQIHAKNKEGKTIPLSFKRIMSILTSLTYACKECDKSWREQWRATLFTDDNDIYTCVFCNRKFPASEETNYDMRDHLLNKHFVKYKYDGQPVGVIKQEVKRPEDIFLEKTEQTIMREIESTYSNPLGTV